MQIILIFVDFPAGLANIYSEIHPAHVILNAFTIQQMRVQQHLGVKNTLRKNIDRVK